MTIVFFVVATTKGGDGVMFEIILEQVTAHAQTWEDRRDFMEDLGLIMLVQLPLFNRMIVVIVKETVATVMADTEDQ